MQPMVAPNPVTSEVKLLLTNCRGKATITIYYALGRTVKQVVQTINTSGIVSINTGHIAAGTYLVSAIVNGKVLKQYFVKQ